jgi:hypothetical protein
MRVLLDECLPRELKTAIVGHEVATVPEMGWGGVPDHTLLKEAAGRFDAFITVDRLLAGRLSSAPLPLRIVLPAVPTNRLIIATSCR